MPKKRTRAEARNDAARAREDRRVNEAFGAAIKAARLQRGFTYRGAAEALDMPVSELQRLEAGDGAVRLPVAWRAARSLGVKIDKVLREDL